MRDMWRQKRGSRKKGGANLTLGEVGFNDSFFFPSLTSLFSLSLPPSTPSLSLSKQQRRRRLLPRRRARRRVPGRRGRRSHRRGPVLCVSGASHRVPPQGDRGGGPSSSRGGERAAAAAEAAAPAAVGVAGRVNDDHGHHNDDHHHDQVCGACGGLLPCRGGGRSPAGVFFQERRRLSGPRRSGLGRPRCDPRRRR